MDVERGKKNLKVDQAWVHLHNNRRLVKRMAVLKRGQKAVVLKLRQLFTEKK
jgi:hypothetical protein